MIFRSINSYLTLLDAEGLLVSYDVTDVTKTVRHYSFNSKDVTGGTLFVAKGVHFKKEYLDEAFSRGAVAYVASAPVAGCGECIIVSDVRRAMAVLAREFWGDPSGELELFAITGTKGKSTTSFFLKYILDGDAERKGGSVCGLSTTVDQFDGKTHKYPMNTTPESPDLYRLLHAGTENGLDRFVVEGLVAVVPHHMEVLIIGGYVIEEVGGPVVQHGNGIAPPAVLLLGVDERVAVGNLK